jgi:hypothetical protein
VRVLKDPRGADAVYIQLSDRWWTGDEDEGDDYPASMMLLPPETPTRIDLFFDGHERLKAIRVENPRRYLLPEISDAAEPFPDIANPS